MPGTAKDAGTEKLSKLKTSKSADAKQGARHNSDKILRFILSLVIADKAEDALKVIEGVLEFPRPTGTYALNKAYVDEQDLMKQLYTYCKSITDACVNAPKTLDERAFIGAKAVSQEFPLGGMTIPTSGKRRMTANLNMYPEVYAGLQYKSSRLLPICESLYLQATNKHNKKEYMSVPMHAESCFNLMLRLFKQQNSTKSGIDGIKRHNVKSAVALVGEEDRKFSTAR